MKNIQKFIAISCLLLIPLQGLGNIESGNFDFLKNLNYHRLNSVILQPALIGAAAMLIMYPAINSIRNYYIQKGIGASQQENSTEKDLTSDFSEALKQRSSQDQSQIAKRPSAANDKATSIPQEGSFLHFFYPNGLPNSQN